MRYLRARAVIEVADDGLLEYPAAAVELNGVEGDTLYILILDTPHYALGLEDVAGEERLLEISRILA